MGEMAMAIRYGCFFSYAHGRHDLMNRFKTALADARAAEDHLRKVLVEGGWLQ